MNVQAVWAALCWLAIKIWVDSLKELRSYGSLKLGDAFTPISAPPSGETVHRIRIRFGGARMVWSCSTAMSTLVAGLGN